jgi:hypothetical protein
VASSLTSKKIIKSLFCARLTLSDIFPYAHSAKRFAKSFVNMWEDRKSLTQSVTLMSTRNYPGGKERPKRKFYELTAVCEPIVQEMWEPRRLTNL